MRFLCLYKPSKAEGVPPTQEEMIEMGKLIEEQMKSGVLPERLLSKRGAVEEKVKTLKSYKLKRRSSREKV